MGIETVKIGKLLYHLTKLRNINSILENGLVSRRILKENNMIFDDVADAGIISKRTLLGLDVYVPFHFHPYSSFDVAVKNTYCRDEFVYICITRDLARYNKFKILPRHPLSVEECTLMEYDEGFNEIDWNTMQTRGTEDEYSKNVKMAECLTDLIIPAKHFHCIYVSNDETKLLIEEKLKQYGITETPPYVNVQKWF